MADTHAPMPESGEVCLPSSHDNDSRGRWDAPLELSGRGIGVLRFGRAGARVHAKDCEQCAITSGMYLWHAESHPSHHPPGPRTLTSEVIISASLAND